ncbi:MAG: membrane protein involved in colicin uptake [Alphaproteobacteria bacterium]|jgi:hypothetical protein
MKTQTILTTGLIAVLSINSAMAGNMLSMNPAENMKNAATAEVNSVKTEAMDKATDAVVKTMAPTPSVKAAVDAKVEADKTMKAATQAKVDAEEKVNSAEKAINKAETKIDAAQEAEAKAGMKMQDAVEAKTDATAKAKVAIDTEANAQQAKVSSETTASVETEAEQGIITKMFSYFN